MQIPSKESIKIEYLLPDEEISIAHQVAPAPLLAPYTPLQPTVVLDRCLPLQNKSQNQLEVPTRKRKIDSKTDCMKHSKKIKLPLQHQDAISPISLEVVERLKKAKKKTLKPQNKDRADRENSVYRLRSVRHL